MTRHHAHALTTFPCLVLLLAWFGGPAGNTASAIRVDTELTAIRNPDATPADSAWRGHLAFLADGTGIWIASNSQYRTDENGEPPAYGMHYWMGLGGTTQHGCLWGESPDREPAVFWSFFTAWDPPRAELLVQQSAPNGTIGIGYESPATGIAEQTFTSPDGSSWEVRHVRTDLRPDTLVTRSFQKSANGEWEARRSYRWIRQTVATRAPC